MKRKIPRNRYLKQLVDFQWDGQVKVVTGLRRCGKSFLLKTLFRDHLLANGTKPSDILCVDLDVDANAALRNPLRLGEHVRDWMAGARGRRYLFVDEIQMCEAVPNPWVPDGRKITFYDTLNGLRSRASPTSTTRTSTTARTWGFATPGSGSGSRSRPI